MANSGELNPLQWNYKSVTTYLGMGFGAIIGGVTYTGIATPGLAKKDGYYRICKEQ